LVWRFAGPHCIAEFCCREWWRQAIALTGRSARCLVATTHGFKGKLRFVPPTLPYSEDLDANNIHVQAPSDVIFLCGGRYSDISVAIPLSLRDAFLKIVDFPPLRDRILIQAEEVTAQFSFFDYYDNILDFESDLAQIVELILLFCESEGSLAELGAFATIEEIAQRLLVIVRQKHWNANSFIRLGPLRLIERKYGREFIYVVEDNDVGIEEDSVAKVDKNALASLLTAPITIRFQRLGEPTTFDAGRSGHVIKLTVGLVQEYGTLDLEEISFLLELLNSARTLKEIQGYLLCAESVGWLKKISKGTTDYFVAMKTRTDAANIQSKSSAKIKNKTRRRVLIRDHWRKTDELRHRSIAQIFGGSP
jgi:hypothetical protein